MEVRLLIVYMVTMYIHVHVYCIWYRAPVHAHVNTHKEIFAPDSGSLKCTCTCTMYMYIGFTNLSSAIFIVCLSRLLTGIHSMY